MEFLLSGIVFLLELLVSFKTGSDFGLDKIDELLTEHPPRMIKLSDEMKKQMKEQEEERKWEQNKNFMETLKSLCLSGPGGRAAANRRES